MSTMVLTGRINNYAQTALKLKNVAVSKKLMGQGACVTHAK